nr:DNA-3-methyladenine glycosylase 2 family protein [uncultured Chryseobacterium sp.]
MKDIPLKNQLLSVEVFDSENFKKICEYLASKDADLKSVLDTHGYPPMWTRGNTFESLVHIILEQQVSLASALAALRKLKERTAVITPEYILTLTDEEMRECYVSRQKTIYIRGLAQGIVNGDIDLEKIAIMSNDEVRQTLIRLKGIGNWTIDVYLMFSLQRADLFPIGDLAAVNALKRLKQLSSETTKDQLLEISEVWQPFRSVASMILWHYYLSNQRKK